MAVLYFFICVQVETMDAEDSDFYKNPEFEKHYPDKITIKKITYHLQRGIKRCMNHYKNIDPKYSLHENGDIISLHLSPVNNKFTKSELYNIGNWLHEEFYSLLSEDPEDPKIEFEDKYIYMDRHGNLLFYEEALDLGDFKQYTEKRVLNIIFDRAF